MALKVDRSGGLHAGIKSFEEEHKTPGSVLWGSMDGETSSMDIASFAVDHLAQGDSDCNG
jgi:hypothetical protein